MSTEEGELERDLVNNDHTNDSQPSSPPLPLPPPPPIVRNISMPEYLSLLSTLPSLHKGPYATYYRGVFSIERGLKFNLFSF
jgi:hypothetical protein